MTDGLPTWISVRRLERADDGTGGTGRAVAWYDADLSSRPLDQADGLAQLSADCPGLTDEVIADLNAEDEKAEVRLYDEVQNHGAAGQVCKVSALRVRAHETSAALVFQQVEFAVGPDWLVTCRHPARQIPHRGEPTDFESFPFEDVASAVTKRWPATERGDGRAPTSGDLGLIILRVLVDTYTDARRALRRWLEAWESDLYSKLEVLPADAPADHLTRHEKPISADELLPLMRLRQMRNELFLRIEPLNRPGMSANRDLIWFPNGDPKLAEDVDQPLDRALRGLRDFGDTLRGSVELAATFVQAEQTHQSERFQELAAFIAAVLLVPTLVAAIYGANIYVPGKDHVTGLLIMFGAMVVTALATGLGIHSWRKRRKRTSRLLNVK